MIKKFTSKIYTLTSAFIIVAIASVLLYAYPSGYTGRTLKTSTQGCGSCHNHSSNVTGLISGPDTVTAGQTAAFTITVTDPNRNKAGVDIAAKYGTLDPSPSSADLKLQNGEITQLHAISMTNHTVTKTFNYIAPSSPGTDTLYATVTSGTSAWDWAPNKGIVVINPSGLKENREVKEFRLKQNYPNPFNPSTSISFILPKTSYATLKVFDVIGNELETLIDEELAGGEYSITWNASDYSNGIYFYKLETEGFTSTKKMILVK